MDVQEQEQEQERDLDFPERTEDMAYSPPDQAMNRSADKVRQLCRAYIERGQADEAGVDLIVKLFALGKERGLSAESTGRLIGHTGSTASRLFNGKYEGNVAKVTGKIADLLCLEAERERMRSDVFIETTAWKKIRALCDFALARNTPVRLVGPSQAGKTHCLREYVRRNPLRRVCYVRIPAAPTLRLAVEAVAKAVGVSQSLRSDELRARAARAVSPNTLLVVDEVHELAMSAGKGTAMKVAEWIREIWDLSGCGMVLCGTSAMESDLIDDPRLKGWLSQLDQRCQRVVRLPDRIPEEDIVAAGEAYGVSGEYERAASLLSSIRMNRLVSCLAMTAAYCSGKGHPRTWKTFLGVYRRQFGEGGE